MPGITRQGEAQVVDEHAVAERLVDMLGFQNGGTQTRAGRNLISEKSSFLLLRASCSIWS